MKSLIFERVLLVIAFCFSVNIISSAQKSIDNLVNKFEEDSNVEVTYMENRDPQTKEIVYKTLALKGDNAKQGQELWKAFEAERGNSVYIIKDKKKSFIIKFLDKNGYSTYILTIENHGSWKLHLRVEGSK